MPGPFIGRNAVIQVNSSGTATTIGYAQNVTAELSQDLIKEYCLGQQNPAILAAGLQSYKVSCSRMFIDPSYLQMVSAGTGVIFILAPGGTATGSPKITLNNVVLSAWKLKWDQKGIVIEDFNGEGQSIQVGNF
jgi:DhnA family fructose-bisphosphate aldolase class Ia